MLTRQLGDLSRAAGRLAQGDMTARVGMAHGSDEIGRLATAFDDMAEQLEQAFARERALEAGRRELISAVSHDLRTPLSTTRAMVEALADEVVTDRADVQRYLGLILHDIQHLSRLIDDLFELSQIDSGALKLRCVPIDVAQLVSETVAAYQAPAAENEVRLEEAVASSVEPTRFGGWSRPGDRARPGAGASWPHLGRAVAAGRRVGADQTARVMLQSPERGPRWG